jgi:hypothetical protein
MWRVYLFLLVVFGGLAAAFYFLPAWQVFAGIGVLSVLLLLARRLILRLILFLVMRRMSRRLGLDMQEAAKMPGGFHTLFKMKGAVLENAEAEVHSLKRIPTPVEPEEDVEHGDADDDDDGPRDYYELDVTIRPGQQTGTAFKLWQPGELALVDAEADWDEDDDCCRIERVEVEYAGSFGPEDEMRYSGPVRLRLLLGVRPGTGRLAFRYYTEKFGEVIISENKNLLPGK